MKMRKLALLFIFFISTMGYSQPLKNLNPDKEGEPWIVGGYRELTPSEIENIPILELPEFYRNSLPSKLNNAKLPYFRSIVLQADGSCSQNSGVAYVFTYETNFLKNIPSKDSENLYPSHFTYNFLNGGDGKNGSNYTDGWQIIKENGVPNVKTYGGLNPLDDDGWMTGYDKYVSGMPNRVLDYYRIKIGTPKGLETLKRWLFDHGNGSNAGGLACFSAGIANALNRPIPLGLYEQKKRIIVNWSDPVDHAMTFVGYDDSVRYDFNGDKQFTNNIDITGDSIVDMRDWEIGAMILANSWGLTWGDSGFAYCPYRLLALPVKEGGISGSQAYVVIPQINVEPQLTLRLRMNHNKRNQLTIRAGVAEYIFAEKPDYQLSFTAFTEKGGALPLHDQGQDTIEIGLDISPLIAQKLYEPVVFFLNIIEDDEDTTGFGSLLSWSISDTKNAKTYYSKDSFVTLVNNGTTYSEILMISNGMPPVNLTLNKNTGNILLSWEKPLDTTGLKNYILFRDGVEIKQVYDTFISLPYDVNGTSYKVKAKYESGLSSPSNTVVLNNNLHLPVAGSGYSLKFDGIDDCIDCNNKINLANHDFTVEFWAKREPDAASRFVVGHGKYNSGSKGLHIGFRGNRLYFGFWGDDISSDETFTDNNWHHYACTYDTVTKLQKLYRDGVFLNERVAKGNYIGTGKLYIGCMSATHWIFNGELDEVRIWDYARTEKQIEENRFYPLNSNEPGLLAAWRFDERSGDSIYDITGNNHDGVLKNMHNTAWKNSTAWSIRKAVPYSTLSVYPGYSKYGHQVNIALAESPKSGSVLIDTLNSYIIYTAETKDKDSFVYSVADDSLVSFYKIIIVSQLNKLNYDAVKPMITVFPNPFKNVINISTSLNNGDNTLVRLFDINGKLMFAKEYHSQQIIIETDNFPEGLYLMNILNEKINLKFKLIKK